MHTTLFRYTEYIFETSLVSFHRVEVDNFPLEAVKSDRLEFACHRFASRFLLTFDNSCV